ncbi:MAG: hypothetical protein WCX70_02435 [Candidatus Paceibacterota bacterium]|jgi:ribosomal protein S21
MDTIEITKNGNESNASIIRRFSKRVKLSNIVRGARSRRYSTRHKSELKKKQDALRRLAKYAEYERLKKLGKLK